MGEFDIVDLSPQPGTPGPTNFDKAELVFTMLLDWALFVAVPIFIGLGIFGDDRWYWIAATCFVFGCVTSVYSKKLREEIRDDDLG